MLTTSSASENAWGEVGKNEFSKRIVHLAEVALNWNSGIRRKMPDYLLLAEENQRSDIERIVELSSYSEKGGKAKCGKNKT